MKKKQLKKELKLTEENLTMVMKESRAYSRELTSAVKDLFNSDRQYEELQRECVELENRLEESRAKVVDSGVVAITFIIEALVLSEKMRDERLSNLDQEAVENLSRELYPTLETMRSKGEGYLEMCEAANCIIKKHLKKKVPTIKELPTPEIFDILGNSLVDDNLGELLDELERRCDQPF